MPVSKSSYHHGDLRRKFIETTLQVIAQKGVSAVTMREISGLNGVSRMAAYRHFKNKHELLCAVAEQGFLAIAHKYEDFLSTPDVSPLEALQALGRLYVEFALENPSLYRLMFGSALTKEERPVSMREAAGRAFGHLPQTVARCQEQGYLRSGSSLAVASILWSMMHGLASLLMDGQLQTESYEDGFPIFLTANLGKQQTGHDRILDLAIEVLLYGLVPRPEGPAS